MSKSSSDLAGQEYWDENWRRGGNRRFGRFSYFHHAFARVLHAHLQSGAHVCEVGCADSVWLPELARAGYTVTGLDYSPAGVRRLRTRLQSLGIEATVVCGDLFEDPLPAESYDAVISLGLIEHFDDVRAVLRHLKRLLKPGGVIITIVPNLVGVWGALQRRLDPQIFAVHVPYTPERLDDVHGRSGFVAVQPARYFGIFGPLILQAGPIRQKVPRLHGIVQALLWALQQGVSWPVSAALGERASGRSFSSHVLGVYRNG